MHLPLHSDNIIVLFDIVLSIVEENYNYIYTLLNQIKNTNGSVKLPIIGIDIPVTIINPAPRDAPDDTPRVYRC